MKIRLFSLKEQFGILGNRLILSLLSFRELTEEMDTTRAFVREV